MTNIYIILLLSLFSCGKEHAEPSEDWRSVIPEAGLKEEILWEPPAATVYIDPGNTVDGLRNGTISAPYNSFSEISWKSNTVYALKRGTVIETGTVMLFADGITLASYGTGKRPVIRSTSTDHAVSTAWEGGNNITIRDVEIYAHRAVSSIIIRTGSNNVSIINARLHGSTWGIRALNNINGLYIHNTEIFNVKDDGIFIRDSRNIEISHCYIHKVNRNWKPPSTPESVAGGDGIQMELCNNWHVHHNVIDRSDSGNKFCFISNNPEQDNGIFEFNVLSGPQNPGFSIYIGDGRDITIRYNYISGPSQSPLWSHASGLKIYYNIFRDISGPLFVSGSAEVYNNLFYKMAIGIEGGSIIARNNIFDLGSVEAIRFKVSSLQESNNLFVYGLPTANSAVENPLFINPAALNFKLQDESAAIDNGVDVGLYYDIEGNIVPSGLAPDIGPYESIR